MLIRRREPVEIHGSLGVVSLVFFPSCYRGIAFAGEQILHQAVGWGE